MSTPPGKPFVNIDEIELQPRPPQFAAKGDAAQRFDARMGQVAPLIGAHLLGYNITAVPPGMRAFPAHNHRVNEEMFFVVEGTGEIRIGGASPHGVPAGTFSHSSAVSPVTDRCRAGARPNAARHNR